MAHLRFHVRFPEDKVKEPIIYQIGREYNVVTNVRVGPMCEKQRDGSMSSCPERPRKSRGRSRDSVTKAASLIRSN